MYNWGLVKFDLPHNSLISNISFQTEVTSNSLFVTFGTELVPFLLFQTSPSCFLELLSSQLFTVVLVLREIIENLLLILIEKSELHLDLSSTETVDLIAAWKLDRIRPKLMTSRKDFRNFKSWKYPLLTLISSGSKY